MRNMKKSREWMNRKFRKKKLQKVCRKTKRVSCVALLSSSYHIHPGNSIQFQMKLNSGGNEATERKTCTTFFLCVHLQRSMAKGKELWVFSDSLKSDEADVGVLKTACDDFHLLKTSTILIARLKKLTEATEENIFYSSPNHWSIRLSSRSSRATEF